MRKKILLTLSIMMTLALASPALAEVTTSTSSGEDTDFKSIFETFTDGVEETSQDLEADGEGITLPTFADDEFSNENTGEQNIVNAISRALDFLKLLLAPLAVFFMVIAGVKLLSGGRENEEAITAAKNYVRYSLEGLLFVFIADAIVGAFFGADGAIFRGGESGAQQAAENAASLFQGIYSLIQVVIGSVAVFVLVLAGMRYIGGSYNDEQISTAKRQITWSLVGLFIVGISEFVAKGILFPDQGSTLGITNAEQLFAQVTNFIGGTIGTLSFVFMLYAGYLYVTARDNEEQVSKAKKIIVGALLGIILASAAFALTNTFVNLDATR